MSIVKLIIEVDLPNLSEAIKAQIEANETSVNQVAFEAGMTPANLYRILSEENKGLPVETLRRIAGAIGSSLPDLTGEWIANIPGFEGEIKQ